MALQRTTERVNVKIQLGCQVDKVRQRSEAVQVGPGLLPLVERIVVFPEATLRAGSFCCLSRAERIAMNGDQGEMAINNLYLIRVSVYQTL